MSEAQKTNSPWRRNLAKNVKISSTKGQRTILAEIDSGSTRTLISRRTVKEAGLPLTKLDQPLICRNADGSENKSRQITHTTEVSLLLKGHKAEKLDALVTDISNDMLIGHDWLQIHNPTINWSTGDVMFNQCPPGCKIPHTKGLRINSKTLQTQFTTKHNEVVTKPKYIDTFKHHLFEKKEFDKLLPHRDWDHKIKLTADAPMEIPAKVYPMTQTELRELDEFINEGLRTGKIQESKSPYVINQYTIKDKFPLPCISELLDNMKDAKYFNKMDIIWGYNNARIKEGDKWKAAFLTPQGLFEPLPLTKLTGNTSWEWNTEQQEAFDLLKKQMTQAPILALPTNTGQFRVKMDASGYAISAVLSQEQDEKYQPITFHSQCMTQAEWNYEIYDKELLAIMDAIKTWQHHLLDVEKPFEIWTDHKNLSYHWKLQKLNTQQAGWYLKLQEYNFTLKHIPESTNMKADILSQLLWYETELEEMDDVQMLQDGIFINHILDKTISNLKILMFEDKHLEEGGDHITQTNDTTIFESTLADQL
ncbi:hypothetical protein AX17_004429 [Amanita inopinata Kibby_2008]|nr:hypothetical protein AX17_004429 [Amanita inopinata Kibby_2008]